MKVGSRRFLRGGPMLPSLMDDERLVRESCRNQQAWRRSLIGQEPDLFHSHQVRHKPGRGGDIFKRMHGPLCRALAGPQS